MSDYWEDPYLGGSGQTAYRVVSRQETNRNRLDAGKDVLDWRDGGKLHLHDGNSDPTRTGWTLCGHTWRDPAVVFGRDEVDESELCQNCLRVERRAA